MSHRTSRLFAAAMLVLAACGNDASSGGPSPDASTNKDTNSLPSCDSLCPAVLAAKCPQGPVSQSDCVSGCETIRAGKCVDKYWALYECGGTSPIYQCDKQGRTGVMGCETQSDALYACAANP